MLSRFQASVGRITFSSSLADNKGPGIIAVTCAVTVLATLFCAARIYASVLVLRRMRLDDCLVLLSIVSSQLKPTFHSFLV